MTKDEKTKLAFEMIEQGVKDVYTSDNFRNYLSCCSKFHNYSLNNTMLILAQKPDATFVAGYSSWKRNFHRHVNKQSLWINQTKMVILYWMKMETP